MSQLLKCGEELARAAQGERTRRIASRLKHLLGGVGIEVEEARVLVSGRGLLRRWLVDPQLRFLTGDRG